MGDITGNRGLGEFFAKTPSANNNAGASASSSSLRPAGKTVIIMDEVDGMGGNEVSDGRTQTPALLGTQSGSLCGISGRHMVTHPFLSLSLPRPLCWDCCLSGSWRHAGVGGADQVDADAHHLYRK